MSHQPSQNAGQKPDAFMENFRLAREAENLRLATERERDRENLALAREMQNGCTRGSRSGSGSVRGRGSRGRGSRGHQTASSPISRQIDFPSRVPQEFTDSEFTSRSGVNTTYPGRGGLSTAVGGILSANNLQLVNQRPLGQQTLQAANHQVPSFQQQENQRPLGHQALQAIDNQVADHHAEAMSPRSDVEMDDGGAVTGSRKTGMNPGDSTHGGMRDSIWAGKKDNQTQNDFVSTMSTGILEDMTSMSAQRLADDDDIERWVPTRISHPTPMPSHLFQQTQTRSSITSNGVVVPPRINSAPGVQGTASSAGSRPPTGPRGGLAKSQWA